MKYILLSLLFFLSLTITSQNNEDLKLFINKNNVALHAVQKTIIAKSINSYNTLLIDLLKEQSAAVALYAANPSQAEALSADVRTKCIDFLKQNSEGSTAYYEFTPKQDLANVSTNINTLLDQKYIQTIEAINVLNPQSLDSLILTIK